MSNGDRRPIDRRAFLRRSAGAFSVAAWSPSFAHGALGRQAGSSKRSTGLGLIQFRGHFLKGGYDVHNGKDNAAPATPPGV